ncbi:helix-turn-helix domain-containing protein [Paraburkholderia caribensis]|uniref:helix-turn-helix domain-containing protein n=1 Tax=Paraburkholderia caribensis TaxID=75105 RepID=UPI001CC4786C|nr:helix-turn-helix domain-containing protein [Paraburkholderia caribensis]
MDLDQYLSMPGAPTVAQLRQRMCDLGYPVKSDAQIRQWRRRFNGRKPDPRNSVGIEKATEGKVSRITFYPDDWQTVWPELAEVQHEEGV